MLIVKYQCCLLICFPVSVSSEDARNIGTVEAWDFMAKHEPPFALCGDLNAEPDTQAMQFVHTAICIQALSNAQQIPRWHCTAAWAQHHRSV